VRLRRLDPQWRNFFEDGSVIDLYEDPEKMRHECEKISPNTYQEFLRFMQYSKQQYHLVAQGYFEKGVDGFFDFFKAYGLFGARKMDFSRSMAAAISRYFSNEKMRMIFEYFIKYVGSSAYDSPGFMNLMPNIQFEFGLWYVDGGLYELARAFDKRMSELGIEVFLNHEVVKIIKYGPKVEGILVRGEEDFAPRMVQSDIVVSNMEVIPAYEKLLGEDFRFMKKLERFEPACSGIVLHLGLNRVYPELAHHNFFYSKDQKRHFDRVFREKKLPDDPTIYLVAPTRSDPTQAPMGCDNLKILPHIPYINEKSPFTYEDCVELKERVLDKLERMGLTDLRKHIVVEDFWTPFDIEKKYFSNRGSIYGVVSDIRKNFAFKAPKRSSKYRNLYFVGGSVNPGGGMPMVVLSGRKVAEIIQAEHPL
jgi:diapolycopene oxygenase